MCGIAGFAGLSKEVKEDSTRMLILVDALGRALDSRGGHGKGYAVISGGETHTVKTSGDWKDADDDFLLPIMEADLCVMHSRWATCGIANEATQAHPFAIHRDGKTVLWGVHNGIIWDAWKSARLHNREIQVDSQELFELIADREYNTMQLLSGYGVALWIENGTQHINLARLSEYSEIFMVELEEGGFVWGSTWPIVRHGLEAAGLTPKHELSVDEVGRVYQIASSGVSETEITDVRVDSDVISMMSGS